MPRSINNGWEFHVEETCWRNEILPVSGRYGELQHNLYIEQLILRVKMTQAHEFRKSPVCPPRDSKSNPKWTAEDQLRKTGYIEGNDYHERSSIPPIELESHDRGLWIPHVQDATLYLDYQYINIVRRHIMSFQMLPERIRCSPGKTLLISIWWMIECCIISDEHAAKSDLKINSIFRWERRSSR